MSYLGSILLQPLNENNFPIISEIADKAFHYVEIKPSSYFQKALENKGRNILDSHSQSICDWVQYYAIVLANDKQIIGSSGLYHLQNEPENEFWLGWFCIEAAFRRRGIGLKALQATIIEAEKIGVNTLRLYTSNHPEEETAQRLYEKLGFRIYDAEIGTEHVLIYRAKTLLVGN